MKHTTKELYDLIQKLEERIKVLENQRPIIINTPREINSPSIPYPYTIPLDPPQPYPFGPQWHCSSIIPEKHTII
jgi:hypothetical protein